MWPQRLILSCPLGIPMGCLIAVGALLFGGVVPVSAQPPEESTNPATLSRTLVIPHDRELEARLRSVQTALINQDRVAATELLADLLAIPTPAVVQVGNVYRDIHFEAERILQSGPLELREAFRRHTEVRAAEEARIALEKNDLLGLLTVAQRYPQTPVARLSLQSLMEQFYDLGRFDAVVACGRILIDADPEPAQAAEAYPLAIRLWHDALREMGREDEVARLEQRWPVNSLVESPFRTPPQRTRPNAPAVAEVASTWRIESPLPERAAVLLRNVVNNLRRDGLQCGLYSRPLVLADRTVWRTFTELVCFDHRSGQVLWRHPLQSPLVDQIRSLNDRSDPARERRLARELAQRVQRDSVLGQMSADHEQLYLVDQVESQLTEDGLALQAGSSLMAFSLQTGEKLWRSDKAWAQQVAAEASVMPPPPEPEKKPTAPPGDQKRPEGDGLAPPPPTEKAPEPAPNAPPAPGKTPATKPLAAPQPPYFFGPPAVTGGSLYVVGQSGETLQLFALDRRTGETLGASPLGDCAPLMSDRRRLSQACPILWFEGMAICTTGTGAIVAFDPFTARMRWAYRYGRDDQQVESTGLLQPSARRDGWQWLHGWQETQLIQSKGRLIAVSPESEAIHCLSAHDGEPLWTVPVERGRQLVTVDEQRIIVAGSTFVRAYRLSDGQVESGLGVITPIASTNWRQDRCEITLASGESIFWSPTTRESGPLTPPRVIPLQARPAGTLDPIQGTSDRQLFHTMSLPGMTGKSDQITVWPDQIERHPADQLITRTDVVPPADASVSSPADVRNQDLIRLRQVEASANPLEALPHLLSLLRQQPADWEIDLVELDANGPAGFERSARTVRLDAYLRGQIQRLWERSAPDQREVIRAAVVQWMTTQEPTEADFRILEPLDFLSNRVLERPLTWTSLAELAQQQLALRRRHQLSTGDDAARALWRLGELHAARGDWRDAATIFGQLRDRLPHAPLSNGQTIAELVQRLPADSPLARRIASDVRTVWPDRTPRVSSRESYESAELFAPIPMAAERGSLFDHVNLATETTGGRTLRFSGLGRSRPWMMTLPPSPRNLRSEIELRQAWGFGQFVVVQYGSELFCVSGLNVKGEASPGRSGILWPLKGSVDTLGNADNAMLAFELQPVIQPVGFTRPAAERFDAHGHRCTWVGPVTPGMVCYLEQGMLVCLETATGRELWRRYDLPAGVKVIGDDRVVILQRDGLRQLEYLSPLDGKTIRQLEWTSTPEDLLRTWGRRVLVASGQPTKGQLLLPPAKPDQAPRPPLKLEMVDLLGPTTLWQAEYPPGAAAFEIDEEWLGVVHPEGRVLFLNLLSGAVVAESPVPWPSGMTAVQAGVTERAVLVSLSEVVTEKSVLEPFQTQRGWRRPAVNGVLASFDRQTGKLSWTRPIHNRIVPLDQPRDLPVIVCADSWKGRPPASEMVLLVPPVPEPVVPPNTPPVIWDDVLQSRYFCLDARNGEILWEQTARMTPPQYTLERDLSAGWVELRLGGQKTRFDYNPPPIPTMP